MTAAPLPRTGGEAHEEPPYGFLHLAKDGQITQVDETIGRWLDREAATLVGRPFISLLSPGSRIYFETHVAPLLAMQGSIKEVALELQRDAGAALPVLASATGVSGAEGPGVTRVALFDMTDRRRFEAELVVARRAAEAAQERFERLFEATPEATAILEPSGKVLLVNAEAETVFGRPRRDLVGLPLETILSAEAGHPVMPGAAMMRASAGLGPIDMIALRPDGKQVPVEVRFSAADQQPDATFIATVRDTTARRALEHERQLAREQRTELVRLQELSRFKTTFVNTAAHELRTPLTPIRLQLAMLSLQAGAADKEGFALLKRNVDRLVAIVDDLLTVAAAQAGTLAIQPRQVDLADLAAAAGRAFADAATRKSITLDIARPTNAIALADPARILQVFQSLLSNAFKFTPQGGKIDIAFSDLGQAIRTTMTDSGMGVAPSDVNRLFEPFVQVHETAAVTEPGSGLGLYICRQIVEMHGGTIGLASPGLGLGTAVWFVLPKGLGSSKP